MAELHQSRPFAATAATKFRYYSDRLLASSLSDLTFGPLISLAFFKFGRNTIPNDINFLRGTKGSSPTNC